MTPCRINSELYLQIEYEEGMYGKYYTYYFIGLDNSCRYKLTSSIYTLSRIFVTISEFRERIKNPYIFKECKTKIFNAFPIEMERSIKIEDDNGLKVSIFSEINGLEFSTKIEDYSLDTLYDNLSEFIFSYKA